MTAVDQPNIKTPFMAVKGPSMPARFGNILQAFEFADASGEIVD